jgi:hypothetical protein
MPETELDAARIVSIVKLTGWVLVGWAVGAGTYLTIAGRQSLSAPQWVYLLEAIHCRHGLLGLSLLGFGLIGLGGMLTGNRRLQLLSSAACAMWCGVVATYLGVAAFTVPSGGNLGAWTIGLCAFQYILRFLLLSAIPQHWIEPKR